MMDLSADELILQIRKGNEEALKLLFLMFEIHFANIEKKMRIIYNYPYNLREDIRIIMRQATHEVIYTYEMDKSIFFPYWRLIVTQRVHRFLEKEKQMIAINNNKYDFDLSRLDTREICDEIDFPTEMYFKDEYQKCLSNIYDEYGVKEANIIMMWSEGYDYNEISKVYNIPSNKVGYIIYKSIKHLRDKYKS